MKEEKKTYISYNDVEEKEVEWVWFPYIPKGMVSILQGDPKSGKTYMIIDIISRITKGDYKPFSNERFEVGKVFLQNSDDPVEQTLLPRLKHQGANLENVYFVDEDTNKIYFKNLKVLEEAIKEVNPTMIVIDPIQAYMGDKDPNSQVQVRNALAPLKKLAEKYNVAIVLIQHLKKGNETKAIYRGAGSIDFIGLARSVFMVEKDRVDKTKRYLLHTTCNVAKEGNCLSYKITEKGVEWLEDKGDVNVDDFIINNTNADISFKYDNAKHFIYGAVASKNKISGEELNNLHSIGGFSKHTFDNARSSLTKENKIYPSKENGKTYWAIKKVQSCNVGGVDND